MTKIRFAERLLCSTVLAGVAAVAALPAYAQSDDSVIVSGTRIKNANLTQASQVQVVGSEEVDLRQATNAEEFIRQLPGVSPGTGPQVNNGQNGAATLNLRNLGTNRNIVLMDSQRIVPFGLGGVTDTNLIPLALVDRAEIVTGGASTVYGADAITGVVNFITKKNFEGLDLNSGYRITEEGDGKTFRIDLTVGGNFGDGKGNAVLSLGYINADPVLQGDRTVGLSSLGSSRRGSDLPAINNPVCAAYGIGTGRDCNPQGSATAAPGSFFSPIAGGIDPVTGTVNTSAFNDFNFNPLNLFQTPQERHRIYAQANYEIADGIEAYTRGFFVRSFVEANLAPSGTFTNQWALPLSNPFLPVGIRDQLCAAVDTDPVTPGVQPISPAACAAAAAATSTASPDYREVNIQLGRRFVEAGPRVQEFSTQAFQMTFGLRGDISPDWSFDVSGQWGQSEITEIRTGWGLASRVQQALRAFNTTSCTVTTGGCVPFNLFGAPGTITAPMLTFVTEAQTQSTVRTNLATAIGVLNGDLGSFKSPFADNKIGVALGAEYRDYGARRFADLAAQTPNEVLGAGAPAPNVRGRYDVYEGFVEMIAPIVEGVPFVKSWQLEGGARYSDYSTAGGKFTWKAGTTWQVNDDLRIRAVYQRASRAPNIGELFAPQVVGLNNLTTDPCQLALPVGNPALTALCVATGVPAGLIGTVIPPIAGQINQTTGGNPNLGVETASTFTGGIVVTPTFIDNLVFTVDYFNISIKDAVSSATVGDVISGCYSTALNPSLSFNSFCALIGRNPATGSLNGPQATTPGVILASSNLGRINTSGIDWTLGYSYDFGSFGNVSYNVTGTYTFENRFQSTPIAIDRECIGFYGVNCDPPQPEWQFSQRATWSWNQFDVSVLHRYIGSTQVEPLQPGFANLVNAYRNIDSFNYLDLTGRWRINDMIEATVTVNNLLDKDPPLVGNSIGTTGFNSGNTYPTVYDPLGRTYNFGIRVRL